MESLTVANSDVEKTIKSKGKPARQKPHGPGQTVLYYEVKQETKPADPPQSKK